MKTHLTGRGWKNVSAEIRPKFFDHVRRMIEEDRMAQKLFEELKLRAGSKEEREFFEELCIAKEVEETMLRERFDLFSKPPLRSER